MIRSLAVISVLVAVVALDAEAKPDTAVATDTAKTAKPDKAAKKAAPKGAPADKAADPVGDETDPSVADADAEKPLTPEEIEAQLPPHVKGPKLVDLGSNIEIELPDGMIMFEREEAQKMLREGGSTADHVLALIGKIDANWSIVIEYDDIGYVTDTDADQLDAKELFSQYEEGTRQQNERRRTMGVPELFLDGWSEMPAYQKQVHHLVWGLKGHSTEGPVINFFTRILGRNGFLSVNLIDAPETIEKSKVETAPILAATRFKTGFRYEDHQSSDKSSGIGLRALVLGGTGIAVMKAAKAGFLIKLLLVFKKGFIVLFAAIGGFFKWLFGRKKNDGLDLPPSDPMPPSDPTPPTDSQG